MFSYKAIYVITLREFKRFFRQRGRLIVTAARPLIWLFIVGSGFTGTESIKFGAAPAKFKVDADGQLTAEAPVVAQTGAVAVTVATGGGTATFYPFTYTAPARTQPTEAHAPSGP